MKILRKLYFLIWAVLLWINALNIIIGLIHQHDSNEYSKEISSHCELCDYQIKTTHLWVFNDAIFETKSFIQYVHRNIIFYHNIITNFQVINLSSPRAPPLF